MCGPQEYFFIPKSKDQGKEYLNVYVTMRPLVVCKMFSDICQTEPASAGK